MTARVILLNGVGSAGKSSIAAELQKIAARSFLHVKMDDFFAMTPPALMGRPDGFVFEPTEIDGRSAVEIREGAKGRLIMEAMRAAVFAMAETGCDLIVDDVLIGDERRSYPALLSAFELSVVGVHASLAALEAREAARGDRLIGLARWQYGRVHEGVAYDFEVRTDAMSAAECAASICKALSL